MAKPKNESTTPSAPSSNDTPSSPPNSSVVLMMLRLEKLSESPQIEKDSILSLFHCMEAR